MNAVLEAPVTDRDALCALFPRDVVGVVATPDMEAARLLPGEEECLTRAVAKRRREYTLGRACARIALARVGIHDYALKPGSDRAPIWPNGITGSITHCDGFCAAVVARVGRMRGLGLDAEPALPFPHDLVRRVCTPGEIERITALPPAEAADWFRLTFSAKESFFKACYPTVLRYVEFGEARIDFEPATGSFAVGLENESLTSELAGLRFDGRFAFTSSHLLTGVVAVPAAARG